MGDDGQVDTKKRILDALEAKYGIVTDACRSIGLARSTFYDWLKTDADFKAAVDEIQETAIDYVEGKLFEKISGVDVQTGVDKDTGEPIIYSQPPSDTAIIFYLKTKAKKRGYIERVEQTGPNGGAIQTESKHIVEFHDYRNQPVRQEDDTTKV